MKNFNGSNSGAVSGRILKAVMTKTQIFCDRFFDRMNKITELGGLVWLDRIFQHTSGKFFSEQKSRADQFRRIINHRGHGEHGGEATSSRRFSLREWRGVKRHDSRKRTYGDLIFSLLIPACRNPA